jgi:hypothetical protein
VSGSGFPPPPSLFGAASPEGAAPRTPAGSGRFAASGKRPGPEPHAAKRPGPEGASEAATTHFPTTSLSDSPLAHTPAAAARLKKKLPIPRTTPRTRAVSAEVRIMARSSP